MNYLNADEKKQVTYTNQWTFPPRAQTDIEKAIGQIMVIQSVPAFGKLSVDAKQEAIEFGLNKLKELTANNRLSDKVRAALGSPEKFDAFTEGYPYAKYNDYINGNRQRSTLVQLAYDGFTEGQIQGLMRWVAQLCVAFYAGLPKGIDTFIWTPHTRHFNTHRMFQATGDKAFYGYVLPAQEQALINLLFADGHNASCPGGNLWTMNHVRRSGLHKSPEVWTRLGWGDMAKEIFSKGLEINFDRDHAQEPYWFLELRHESTNTRLRFIVEG